MSSTEPPPEAPTAEATDSFEQMLRSARRQAVIDLLAVAVIDLLFKEHAPGEQGQ